MKRRRPSSGAAVLIGFMGSGKSSVGKELARRLGLEFVDVDERIESDAGKGIGEIFAAEGEGAFRQREREAVREAVSVPGRVIATGGGAFQDSRNRRLLKAYAPVVFLDVSFETALGRLEGDASRPLLSGGDREKKAAELLEKRRPAYLMADYRVNTETRDPGGVAGEILLLLGRASKRVPPASGTSGERKGA